MYRLFGTISPLSSTAMRRPASAIASTSEAMVGAGIVMAKANGIDRAGHVRDKLTWLGGYAETVRGLTELADEGLQLRLHSLVALMTLLVLLVPLDLGLDVRH